MRKVSRRQSAANLAGHVSKADRDLVTLQFHSTGFLLAAGLTMLLLVRTP